MRYIILKTEEIEALSQLHRNSTNSIVRKQSWCLLLSHQEQMIADLSGIFDVHWWNVERWFDSCAKMGMDSSSSSMVEGLKLF